MVAFRRLSLVLPLVLGLAACIGTPSPTPIPRLTPPGTQAPAPTSGTSGPTPTSTPLASPRPASGFFFRPAEIVDYYEQAVGFMCEGWHGATTEDHLVQACRLADAENPAADRVITLIVDADGALADVQAGYVHRDGSTVDRDAALRFFATVVGASLGGTDGQTAVTWLKDALGSTSASLDVRGLRFATFLPDLPEDRGSALFIEIATPAFTAAR